MSKIKEDARNRLKVIERRLRLLTTERRSLVLYLRRKGNRTGKSAIFAVLKAHGTLTVSGIRNHLLPYGYDMSSPAICSLLNQNEKIERCDVNPNTNRGKWRVKEE